MAKIPEEYKEGDIVYVTLAGQDYLARNKGESFNINVYGRLAKILEIYDWESDKGKDIIERREKASYTWKKLNSKDFKFVLLIYAPDLLDPSSNKQGIAFPELFAEFHPMAEGKIPMFRKWQPALLEDAFKKCQDFTLTNNKKPKKSKTKAA